MSRPRTPQQFILDEETDFELTEVIRHSRSNSSSSNESLLLLPSEKPPPPPPQALPPSAPTNAQQQHHHHQSHFTISIPSRSQVFLAKQNPQLSRSRRPKHLKLLLIGLSSLLLFAWSSTEFLTFFTRFNGSPKIQVVLMISNGMGTASETFARSYLQFLNSTTNTNNSYNSTTGGSGSESNGIWSGLIKNQIGKGGFIQTPLDSILVGTARTRSSNSLITDSSASSTAISCLLKTFNGGIAVTPSLTPCGTILESAHHQGFLTGLITNSDLTSSTPASFFSHTTDSSLQGEIAKFLIGTDEKGLLPQGKIVDLALGGGKCWFVGNDTEGSCRNDQQDLLKDLDSEGIELIQGMKGLREWKDGGFSLDSTKKKKKKSVLGFFSNDEMDYEVDRQRTEHLIDEQPSLKEMSSIGLNYLKQLSTSSQTKGFFLLIQNGKIDSASHENDPVSLLNEILSYFETVELVKNWVKQQNEVEGIKTVLISVSDYETGGLSLGRQLTETSPEYLWFPEVLQNSTHSTNYLGKLLTNRYPMTTRDWVVTEIYEKGLGIFDSEKWELDELWEFRTDSSKASRVLADAISRRAQIGWSTSGHSGVDVNLYAYGHNSTGLKGCVDNTEVGEFIAHTMGLNLDVVTLELNKNLKSWFDPTAGNVTNRSTSDLKHYEGEF